VPLFELLQGPDPQSLLLPLAAPLFGNIRQIKKIWRKRVGVEIAESLSKSHSVSGASFPKKWIGAKWYLVV
jgi:hypothetical protein